MSTPETRCPQCGAMLRADAAWCTLCHADLRPAPAPQPVSVPDLPGPPDIVVDPAAVTLPPVVIDPLTAPLDQVVAAALAEQAAEEAGAPAPVVPVVPESPSPEDHHDPADPLAGIQDTDVMFALLRGETQDPLLAKFGGRFDDKSSRIMFMVAGVAVMTLVVFAGLYVVGLIFG